MLNNYGAMLSSFLPLVIMVLIFYFLLIRPQRKRDKAEREMRNSIQVGDEISTIGGFIGKVVSTKLKLYRWAIRGKEAAPVEKVEEPKA